MSFPARALELENLNVGPGGEPTLGAAFDLLWQQWTAGSRDREVAVHLMFLAWYLVVEPPHLTGTPSAATPLAAFEEVHTFHAIDIWRDAEMLYVVGLMAAVCPWGLGDASEWEARSLAYRSAYRALAPDGLSPDVFAGRGAYGDYFAGHAALPDAY